MRAVDWNAPFYGSQNCGLMSDSAMLGISMTILIGEYKNDSTDVAIIADRRRSVVNAPNREPMEKAFKTLRLGPECAIGFAGAEPLQNGVLAKLFGIPCPPPDQSLIEDLVLRERGYDFPFLDVEKALNAIVPEVIRVLAPPEQYTMYIILACALQGVPILAGVSAGSEWQVTPYVGRVWSRPKEMITFEDQKHFHDETNVPGMDYDERMLAAVKFCSRYRSVNNQYVIRRLSAGFAPETGHV